jgi:hypothetical protein
MTCDRARRLFGACWDDELTQAEREWLEGHFASCDHCRADYDGFSRTLELAGTLPRVEAAPELVERVLARTHRASAVPDRVGQGGLRWLPVAAVAATVVLVAAVLFAVPRMKGHPAGALTPGPVVLESGQPATLVHFESVGKRVKLPARRGASAVGDVAIIPDSLFDHSEDVEFILDPVTLHRGRPSLRSAGSRLSGVQGQQAIITF